MIDLMKKKASEYLRGCKATEDFSIVQMKQAYCAGYKAAQPRWIDCDEQLPEHGQKVLAVGSGKGIYLAWMKGSLVVWEDGGYVKRKFLFWMPLPETKELFEDD